MDSRASSAEKLVGSSPAKTSTHGSEPEVAPEQKVAPGVTFVLRNSGDDSLFINMDKGWQAVIFAFSGQPPNAKSLVMYPVHCMAPCDSEADAICPVCEEPKRAKAILAAENHDEVLPGEVREVRWDGLSYVSERGVGTRNGKSVTCQCYQTTTPAPASYTIRACALRKTKTAKKSSRYICAESKLDLPVHEQVQVELDFEE